jgi:hypothetical protein
MHTCSWGVLLDRLRRDEPPVTVPLPEDVVILPEIMDPDDAWMTTPEAQLKRIAKKVDQGYYHVEERPIDLSVEPLESYESFWDELSIPTPEWCPAIHAGDDLYPFEFAINEVFA